MTNTDGPRFIGKDVKASVVGLHLGDGDKGRTLIIGLEVALTPTVMSTMPGFVGNAMKPGNDLKQITLATKAVQVGGDLKRHSDGQGKLRFESGTLKGGVTLKFGGDAGVQPCAYVTLVVGYSAERVKYFCDHYETWLAVRLFSAKTEQITLPVTVAKAVQPTSKKRTVGSMRPTTKRRSVKRGSILKPAKRKRTTKKKGTRT